MWRPNFFDPKEATMPDLVLAWDVRTGDSRQVLTRELDHPVFGRYLTTERPSQDD
jgi:hypothetical protein